MAESGFPWINIPMFSDTDEQQVFVARREELSVLYRGLVEAGNAVRAGRFGIHRKFVVHGYLGVGKSALILEALRLLRDPQAARDEVAAELPEPEEPERWLILRISGKHVTGLDGVVASLRQTMLHADSAGGMDDEDDTRQPRLALYDHVQRQAETVANAALQLAPLHRLLRTREVELYDKVRSDLAALAATIEQIAEAAAQRPGTVPAADPTALRSGQQEEAASLVSALNRFFRAASAAGLPTLLIFDDFDELAITAGTSPAQRARTLGALLHEFSNLSPTCLVLSLRSEFMSETILRQFRRLFLPPLCPADAKLLLGRWAQVQQPPLNADATLRLQQLGERFLTRFAADEPVVVPFRFLQLIAWLANNFLIYNLQDADEQRMLWRYFTSKYPIDVVRALRALLPLIPPDQLSLCASASPLDGTPYRALAVPERHALERAGLLRAAAAGDSDDPRLVLDPLIAYLRVASMN
jgi:hypothetical protein